VATARLRALGEQFQTELPEVRPVVTKFRVGGRGRRLSQGRRALVDHGETEQGPAQRLRHRP
jgi:hypothetical protein